MRYLCFLLHFYALQLHSARLDIKSDINTSVKSFSNLIYESKNYNLSYIKSNIDLLFTLKDIVLEKTKQSYADVSVGFRAFTISQENLSSKPYLKEIYDFYGNKNTFFPHQAYITIKNFLYPNWTFTSGRLPYTLSNGVVFSDNSKGIDGFKIDITNRFAIDTIEIFYFRAFYESNYNLSGITLNKSLGEGVWQIYLLKSISGLENTPFLSYTKTDKTYKGISYSIDTKKLSYSFEFVNEGGKSTLTSAKRIKKLAYAFNLKALWNLQMPVVGKIKARSEYLKSSAGTTTQKDKTFYSPFSKRFCGFERCGVGEIIASSPWSVIRTSQTITGLPTTMAAGIRTFRIGFDMPIQKYIFSYDFYRYRTTSFLSSKEIGKEHSIKLSHNLSEKTSFSLIYSKFKPEGLLKTTSIKNTSLISFEIKTSF